MEQKGEEPLYSRPHPQPERHTVMTVYPKWWRVLAGVKWKSVASPCCSYSLS